MTTTKKGVFLAVFLIASAKGMLAQQLNFQYDGAGNQISREWICVNCGPYSPVSQSPVGEPVLTATEPDKTSKTDEGVIRKLTAYPNPFSETLYVGFQSNRGVSLLSIEVHNTAGVKLYQNKRPDAETDTAIPFRDKPAGFYLVTVRYSDKKVETLKVVKRD